MGKFLKAVGIVWLGGGLLALVSMPANATSAFARKYGVACQSCHTVSFPRLNFFGEKFMRNGFQMPSTQDGSQIGKQVIGKDLTLEKKLGDLVGVRGKLRIIANDESKNGASIGSTIFGAFFVSGTIAKNIPVWMEFETNTANGETELHNYFVGWNNIGGSSIANLRVGAWTPTEWTSFSDQKRAFDSPFSHPGAFRPGKFSKTKAKPYNLRTTTGLEYYGYTGPFFWALGTADKMGGNFNTTFSADNHRDYYGVARAEVPTGAFAGSSLSFLGYLANLGSDNDGTTSGEFQVYDVSGNLRWGPLDLFAAYVWDNDRNVAAGQGDDHSFTAEADYKFRSNLLGILRFDTVDDGKVIAGDSRTTYWTPGIVYAPRQNLKVTASYAIDASDDSNGAGGFGDNDNIFDVELQFMF